MGILTPVITLFAPVITLLKNLWAIGVGFPPFVAYIAPIIQIIGSEEFRKLMKSIYDAAVNAVDQIRKESPEIPQTITNRQRLRIIDRMRRRVGLAMIGMSEAEYVAYCNIKNTDTNQTA
jgi:hypothetical protein